MNKYSRLDVFNAARMAYVGFMSPEAAKEKAGAFVTRCCVHQGISTSKYAIGEITQETAEEIAWQMMDKDCAGYFKSELQYYH